MCGNHILENKHLYNNDFLWTNRFLLCFHFYTGAALMEMPKVGGGRAACAPSRTGLCEMRGYLFSKPVTEKLYLMKQP